MRLVFAILYAVWLDCTVLRCEPLQMTPVTNVKRLTALFQVSSMHTPKLFSGDTVDQFLKVQGSCILDRLPIVLKELSGTFPEARRMGK